MSWDYARDKVELAYATTVYGVQGETVSVAHVAVGAQTSAKSAYVAMTRGRESNVAHMVAGSIEEARLQWIQVFGRDRADLGPAHAAQRAAEDIERYGSRGMARYVRNPMRQQMRPPRPWSVPAPATSPGLGRPSTFEPPSLGI